MKLLVYGTVQLDKLIRINRHETTTKTDNAKSDSGWWRTSLRKSNMKYREDSGQ